MTKAIRNRLRELMAEKGRREGRRITQRITAEETGIARSTIDRYARNETVRYDEDVVLKLCLYFDCEPGDLIILQETEGQSSPEIKPPLAIPA